MIFIKINAIADSITLHQNLVRSYIFHCVIIFSIRSLDNNFVRCRPMADLLTYFSKALCSQKWMLHFFLPHLFINFPIFHLFHFHIAVLIRVSVITRSLHLIHSHNYYISFATHYFQRILVHMHRTIYLSISYKTIAVRVPVPVPVLALLVAHTLPKALQLVQLDLHWVFMKMDLICVNLDLTC